MKMRRFIRWSGIALTSIFLLTVGGPNAMSQETRRQDRESFVPSLEGKKLLHYRPPAYDLLLNDIDKAEQVGFDGLIIGGLRPFYINEPPHDFEKFVEQWRKVPFKRYTDNFYLCYSGVDAIDKTDFDWFHDFSWICDNWRTMAQVTKDAGFVGICFDSEYYGGKPLFGYEEQKYAHEKSFEEYQVQVRKRGAEIMRAVNEVYPDIQIIFLFGYSGSFYGVPQHPRDNARHYGLVSAFVDGMLSECGPDAAIHDMHEQSFAYRHEGSYVRGRALQKDVMRKHSVVPELFDRNHKAGFSIWADCWENASEGRAMNVDDFEINFYTPHELAWTMNRALAYSDKYVWMWPGVFDWWKGTMRTVDENGENIVVPIPEEYMASLVQAHDPNLQPPPRERKPNTYRNVPASSWKYWPDEQAFGDLWTLYKEVLDLPETWKFRTDPDEVGVRERWFARAFKDDDWDSIQIREFWENQGYSPYDGQAWYRSRVLSPVIPADRKVFLAFGAIADEATIYVNGEAVHASEVGDNIRHQRLVIDVTKHWKSGADNDVAVRVWNVVWCGGIWKNVKLLTDRDPRGEPSIVEPITN